MVSEAVYLRESQGCVFNFGFCLKKCILDDNMLYFLAYGLIAMKNVIFEKISNLEIFIKFGFFGSPERDSRGAEPVTGPGLRSPEPWPDHGHRVVKDGLADQSSPRDSRARLWSGWRKGRVGPTTLTCRWSGFWVFRVFDPISLSRIVFHDVRTV